MVSISKRASGEWQNTSYGIRGTATDTITTLPTTIYSDGTNATVSIKGNTTQSGTPTPDNPVTPQGCGELDSGQYKISISSANTTTPIYLGEVETTRKIKKVVLTGEEGWKARTSPDNSYVINYSSINTGRGVTYHGMCSHFANPQTGVSNITSGQGYFGTSAVSFRLDDTTDLTQWTNWLAQQYAAGTPVCVWYILAEPTTGIVNEPLMRIGDYADEVSGVSIPTTDGTNTLSVDTTVQPSEVSVNYHGWHMGTVHERTAGQWD